jgi:ribonuclease Z
MSTRSLVALGTASQAPTRERNHNGYFLKWDDEGLLFDPGEGTQRQMIFAGVRASEITRILITHLHGDHCLGLPGVLQRLSLDGISHEIHLYYPASGQPYIDRLKQASIYHDTTRVIDHPISAPGAIFAGPAFTIEAQPLEHSTDSWGYRLQEPDGVTLLPEKLAEHGIHGPAVGRLKQQGSLQVGDRTIHLDEVSTFKRGQRFAFVMDTRLCDSAYLLAREVDLLVCESTFLASETEEAIAYGHLTATQAAEIAQRSSVDLLVLTHFSRRYPSTDDFLMEAQPIHPNVVAVRDGDRVDLPHRERQLGGG